MIIEFIRELSDLKGSENEEINEEDI